MLPGMGLFEGKFSSASFFFSFLVCKQFLKGIVYPLVVNAHIILDLVHQRECITFWGS